MSPTMRKNYIKDRAQAVVTYVVAANSLTQKDHDPEAVTGEPSKLFWSVCIREESDWRLFWTLVSVPV